MPIRPKHSSAKAQAGPLTRGLVLCGGRSSRMGMDKGSLIYKGKRWYQYPKAIIRELGMPCSVSVRHAQLPLYRHWEPLPGLCVDTLPVEGPLGGILSAHKRYPHQDLLVLACDMLFLRADTLRLLLRARESKPTAGVILFGSPDAPEPLAALYTSAALQKTLAGLEAQGLEDFSLRRVIARNNPLFLPISPAMRPQFRNWNEPGSIL